MDASESELQIHLRGVEEADRISPNFLEPDQLDNITNPFDSDWIDTDKDAYSVSNTDVMNNENDISCSNASDNAVDPYLYINRSNNDCASTKNELYPNAVASPNVQLPNCQQSLAVVTSSSAFARQQSVNFVMEVLATCPVNNTLGPNYPLTPSPQLGDEDLMIDHPSPCFMHQDVQRARTVSENLPFLSQLEGDSSRSRAFSFDHSLFPRNSNLFGSFPTKSAAHNTGTETCSSSNTDANTDSTTSDIANENDEQQVLESLPSFAKASLQNPPKPLCEDSLDLAGMMVDFIESANTVDEKDTEKIPPVTPNHTLVDLTDEQPCTSKSVPKMERTASYKRRRNQNNKACRESRKKRKIKQSETEQKAKQLEVENDELQVKILRLEKEVEEVRVLVLQQMSGRPKR